MSESPSHDEFLEKIRQRLTEVKSKRARFVIELLLKKGEATMADIEKEGYHHAARAARDVREYGIPLHTGKANWPDGRPMAVYTLDRSSEISDIKSGRKTFSKAFKNALLKRDGEICAYCHGVFPGRALQIDHLVPYEVGGDDKDEGIEAFQLLCGSCNRSKSWSCESCQNWMIDQDPATCLECMWGSPKNYRHMANEEIRALRIVWQGDEVGHFDKIKRQVEESGSNLPDHIKSRL